VHSGIAGSGGRQQSRQERGREPDRSDDRRHGGELRPWWWQSQVAGVERRPGHADQAGGQRRRERGQPPLRPAETGEQRAGHRAQERRSHRPAHERQLLGGDWTGKMTQHLEEQVHRQEWQESIGEQLGGQRYPGEPKRELEQARRQPGDGARGCAMRE